jgi:hypothetical protein
MDSSVNSRRTAPRIGCALLTAAVTATALISDTGAPAAAATANCEGIRIATESIHVWDVGAGRPGEKIGEVQVFYDRTDGTNCALTVHTGRMKRVYAYTRVSLTVCQERTPGNTCTPQATAVDDGTFHSYAGAVTLPARGRCISAIGAMDYAPHAATYMAWTKPGASFCR